jgi:hypothetical protein
MHPSNRKVTLPLYVPRRKVTFVLRALKGAVQGSARPGRWQTAIFQPYSLRKNAILVSFARVRL